MLKRSDFHEPQAAAVDFMNDGDDSLIIAGVGSGKTTAVLTALSDKMTDGLVNRALVVGPPRVAGTVWHTEVDEWEHLQGLSVERATGNPAQRFDAIEGPADVVTLSYDSLMWYMLNFDKAHPFDAIVFDEIDMMSRVQSKRYKKTRSQVKHFDTRIGMTATPTATSPLNVWSQARIIDNGVALGTSFTSFKNKHFYPTDFNQHHWAPHPGTLDYIHKQIAPFTYQIPPADNLRPPPNVHEIRVDFGKELADVDKAFNRLTVVELPNKVLISADSRAIVAVKRLQMANGFAYYHDKDGEKCAHWFDEDKLDAVLDIRDQRPNEPVFIAYTFIAELEALKRRIPGLVTDINDKNILEWNRGNIGTIAAHPAALSHGVNLQKSGCRTMILTSPPPTYRRFNQLTGRINRQGNPRDKVDVFMVLRNNSYDDDALASLYERQSDDELFLKGLQHAIDSEV